MVNMREPVTGNVMDTALEFAWGQLQYVPHDEGRVHIEFETSYRFEYRRDPTTGDPLMHPTIPNHPLGNDIADGWFGTRKASTEEGYSNLRVRVYRDRHDEENDDVWIVEIGTDSRDCDGQYTGGHVVTFKSGQVPIQESEPTRDHTAEAAGY